MAKPFLKKKSKRMTCRRRYKIERKVREHDRKIRKESSVAKKKRLQRRPAAGTPGGAKANKPMLRVPNKCPFKEEVLVEASRRKEEAEELKRRRKEAREKAVDEKRKEAKSGGTLEALVGDAARRQQIHGQKQTLGEIAEKTSLASHASASSMKSYFSEVRKVLESADVVLEVLDARDPLGCRCPQLEARVLADPRKRLVLLLNKIDLVPKQNVVAWLKYLRQELPTIAFKASTQEQQANLGRVSHAAVSYATSRCIGADLLLKLLGNYSRRHTDTDAAASSAGTAMKTCIRVGVVGFPNVGKSSVINSLRRTRSCNVGAMPGLTRCVQEVELDKRVRLLDSPGVVFASSATSTRTEAEIALRNAVKIESLEDPAASVEIILRRCAKEKLMLQYGIAEFADTSDFLALIARKLGRLRKGGVPDVNAAARRVLHDWNAGKIRYWSEPPARDDADSGRLVSFELVKAMSEEFCLDEIDEEQNLLVAELPAYATPMDEASAVVFPSGGFTDGRLQDDDAEQAPEPGQMEVDGGEINKAVVGTRMRERRRYHPLDTAVLDDEEMVDEADESDQRPRAQAGKHKKVLKAAKKKKRRTEKIASSLSELLDAAMPQGTTLSGGVDAYDFDANFTT